MGGNVPTGLLITFKYWTMCVPGSEECMVKKGSPEYTALWGRLEALIDSVELEAPVCMGSAPSCFNFKSGFDDACLRKKATAMYDQYRDEGKSSEQAKAMVSDKVFKCIKCGIYGPDGQGGCIEEDAGAATSASTTAVSASTGGGGGGDSGGGLPIVVVAGAAGGAVVLIIIVVVMMNRRGRGEGTHKADDRTVVAFENPMYDDPGQAAGSRFNAPADNEGLYDEPAFTAGGLKKANPVYESTEGLDGAADGDGYLDVAPDAQ